MSCSANRWTSSIACHLPITTLVRGSLPGVGWELSTLTVPASSFSFSTSLCSTSSLDRGAWSASSEMPQPQAPHSLALVIQHLAAGLKPFGVGAASGLPAPGHWGSLFGELSIVPTQSSCGMRMGTFRTNIPWRTTAWCASGPSPSRS
eukprot:4741202-Amphidinium_carterae.1